MPALLDTARWTKLDHGQLVLNGLRRFRAYLDAQLPDHLRADMY